MRMRAVAAAFLGATGLALAAWASGLPARSTSPDAILASGFDRALADTDTSWQAPSPNLWLSAAGPTSAGRSFSVGDVITIANKGGRPLAVEVTGLQHVDGDRIGVPAVDFQLVTARSAHDPASPPMRFLFALGTSPQPVGLPRPQSGQLGHQL